MDIIRPAVKGGKGRLRTGRGFSKAEIEKAEWTAEDAFSAGVAVDPRRKSCHDTNVEKLAEIKTASEG